MTLLHRIGILIAAVTVAYFLGRLNGARSVHEKQAAITLTRTTATAGQIIKNEATYDQIFQKIAADSDFGKTNHACPVPRIIRVAIDELPDRGPAN